MTNYTIDWRHADVVSQCEISTDSARIVALTRNGVDAVQRPSAQPAPSVNAVLVPWPNRVRDGRWLLHGEVQQLTISEPARSNAIHGLLLGVEYALVSRTDASVELAATVAGAPGYPFTLETRVDYSLDENGLTVRHTITNQSAQAAPVGFGAHPYLTVGTTPMRELTVAAGVSTEIVVDDRLLPIGRKPAPATLASGIALAAHNFDTAFADPAYGSDGRYAATLTAPDGRSVALWADASAPYLQIYTTDAFPGPDGEQLGAVALEPMSMPANALNSGEGVTWLEPNESAQFTWGIEPRFD